MYVHQVAEHRLRHVRLSSRLPLILVLFVTRYHCMYHLGWLCSRVVSVLDSGAEGPGFKSQPRRCPVTVLGKLFTPIVPLFTKPRNWYRPTGWEGNCGPGGK